MKESQLKDKFIVLRICIVGYHDGWFARFREDNLG